jgi:spermidine synthase
LFGVVLVPAIGLKVSLIIVGVGYLILLPRLSWRQPRVYVLIALAGLVAFAPLSTHLITRNNGEKLLIYREGILGSVTVLKTVQGDLCLKVNDRFQMGGTSSQFSDRSQGHIPLLLHPNPHHVLFLGLGTGGTLAAAADYSDMETDGVELVPEVIDVMDQFRSSTGDLIHNPRIHIHTADARRFINQSKKMYDVIIADLFHPARDGAGTLYTLEHFNAIRSHLEPNGIFCQWLPLYQMNLDTLRTITHTFLVSFPETRAFITHYNIDTPIIGLIGANQLIRYDRTWFDRRVRDDSLRNELKKLRLTDTYTLMGRFIAGRNDLIDFAGEGPINTDDRPVVTYSTPSFVYTKQELPYKRLLTLLRTFSPKPEQIIDSNDIETSQRLMAYWRARNDFITLGTTVNPFASESEMIKTLADPLLSIVQESPDFAAAYNPLLGMALNRSRTDKKEALELLHKLQQVNPQRTEAGEIIRYISSKE